MAIIDINGSLSINLNQTTVDPSAARNIQFTSTSESSLSASLELEVAPGVWKQAFAIYTGNFVYANNALIGGSINGFQTWLADNSLSIQGSSFNVGVNELISGESSASLFDLESLVFGGDDTLLGSTQGGSVIARLLGGNDTVEIYGGISNDINTNWGSDTINLFGGNGRIRAGANGHQIRISGGQFDVVNGNNGEDTITNWSAFAGTVRGGADNDLIIAAPGSGMNAYGDLGSDIFKPYIGSRTTVLDYQPGIDRVDLSELGNAYNIIQISSGLAIGVGSSLIMTLEGVTTL